MYTYFFSTVDMLLSESIMMGALVIGYSWLNQHYAFTALVPVLSNLVITFNVFIKKTWYYIWLAVDDWVSKLSEQLFKHLLPPQFSSYFHYLQDHECTWHLSEDRLMSSWFCEGLLLVLTLILKCCTIYMRPLNKTFGHTNVKSTYELISHCLAGYHCS